MGFLRRLLRQEAEEVVRAGAYELRTTVLHPGTRSEGRIGRLARDGVAVTGQPPGAVIEADGVRFTFQGDERPHLWSRSGWTVAP
jgi:hypothetical protein